MPFRVHSDRVVGGHRRYWDADRVALTGSAGGPRGGPRAQCTNNMKQIALAALNFEGVYRQFPPGINLSPNSVDPNPGWNTPPPAAGPYTGCLAYLLPYVEQMNVYNAIPLTFSSPIRRSGPGPTTIRRSTSMTPTCLRENRTARAQATPRRSTRASKPTSARRTRKAPASRSAMPTVSTSLFPTRPMSFTMSIGCTTSPGTAPNWDGAIT